MRQFRHDQEPLRLYGIPFFQEHGHLERLPASVREQVPELNALGCRCPGARLCFRTDAESFTVRIRILTLSVDVGMALYSSQSANVFIGNRPNACFAGLVNPPDYETKEFERTFQKSGEMEDVTVFFPFREQVDYVMVEVDEAARVEAPTPYRDLLPVVYYGSSITQGACATRPSNAYNALLSNWLNVDYYNLGFSGKARGELEIADYISTIPMSAFVMDYDYNAPDPDFLAQTHEPFFRRIRERHPGLPILLLSSPNFEYKKNAALRRDIIRQTWLNAREAGDTQVYFIDGSTLFGEEDRHCCTVDRIHPNDLGFYRMAKTVEPTLRKMLNL